MSMARALVFVNGWIKDYAAVHSLVRPEDTIVAVDGGLNHLDLLGLTPNFLIGDLDSVDPNRIKILETAGIRLVRFQRDKDETDLELALRTSEVLAADQIIIIAALGGRLDQTLSNIALLMRPELMGKEVRLEDGCTEVFLIRSAGTIQGEPGDTVSLIPVSTPVTDVKTDGLMYPLKYETLYPDRTRGISNVLLGDGATVQTRNGILLCVHIRRKKGAGCLEEKE